VFSLLAQNEQIVVQLVSLPLEWNNRGALERLQVLWNFRRKLGTIVIKYVFDNIDTPLLEHVVGVHEK
jgi:hypothetical protein